MADAFPILRPVAALLLSALLPFASARLLAWTYLRGLAPAGEERHRQLVPFRRAALLAGAAQLQLAWMLGLTSLGPALAPRPLSLAAVGFAFACAAIAFAAGGVARRVEEPPAERSPALAVIVLRLRLLAFLLGPLLFGIAASELPLAEQPALAAVAALICVIGVAYGGLAVALLTGALRRAGGAVATAAREAARREGVSLLWVLRLPTGGARLANAAAIPWARTMVVTDAASELLAPDELDAVLAHEAGHLSEGPRSTLFRLGVASILLFSVTVAPELVASLPPLPGGALLLALVACALVLVLPLRRHARRMEERADARACETVGGPPLARALRRLHAFGQSPMVTGRRRVHPDLYDRLVAAGDDPGERPPPPPRGGLALGLALGLFIVFVPIAVDAATAVGDEEITTLGEGTARFRLFVDPWDGAAVLALAWDARYHGELDRARDHATDAAAAGPDEVAYYTLWAEIEAADGNCDAAREAFDRALEADARRRFDAVLEEPLELGGYPMPPTYQTHCAR